MKTPTKESRMKIRNSSKRVVRGVLNKEEFQRYTLTGGRQTIFQWDRSIYMTILF
jgi:hypothetical protein